MVVVVNSPRGNKTLKSSSLVFHVHFEWFFYFPQSYLHSSHCKGARSKNIPLPCTSGTYHFCLYPIGQNSITSLKLAQSPSDWKMCFPDKHLISGDLKLKKGRIGICKTSSSLSPKKRSFSCEHHLCTYYLYMSLLAFIIFTYTDITKLGLNNSRLMKTTVHRSWCKKKRHLGNVYH